MLELPGKCCGTGPSPGPGKGRRDFTSFCHTIRGSNRVFALRSHLHVAPGGRIFLRDFLAALSRACHLRGTRSVVTALVEEIQAAGWEPIRGPGPDVAFRWSAFELCVRVESLRPGIEAVHLFLGYGGTEASRALYLGRLFPPHGCRIVPADDWTDPSGNARPPLHTPRVIHTTDLVEWFRREPCTVLTGAGISRASGIAPFHGPGSLGEFFPVDEPFPGAVFDWAVHRPAELASVVGSFQAALLGARPNPAHLALADLERRGVVRQILTTNFDELHQSAGSVRVKRLETGEDWWAGCSARALLVTGVSQDDYGVVEAARTAGVEVIVLGPEVPEFVRESDLYLPGLAEVVLPEVAGMLGR